MSYNRLSDYMTYIVRRLKGCQILPLLCRNKIWGTGTRSIRIPDNNRYLEVKQKNYKLDGITALLKPINKY